MTLNLSFYEAVAQIIPVLLLAMLVDAAIVPRDLKSMKGGRDFHGAAIGNFAALALIGEGMCLVTLAVHDDTPLIAVVTIIALADAAVGALFGPLTRMQHGAGSRLFTTYAMAVPLLMAVPAVVVVWALG